MNDATVANLDGIPGTHLLLSPTDTPSPTAPLSATAKPPPGINLIPTPSPSPADPLNWSPRRKALATTCWVLYVLANGITASNLPSILTTFSAASTLPLATLNAGTGYLFLLAGWGLLFWQPFALQYGKRPTYLVSLLGLLALSLWAPAITQTAHWYARSLLLGFCAAPIEALPELSIADVHFAHQRGAYFGLYAATLVGSNFIAPVVFGWVADGQGWRWVFYWPAILCGVVALLLLLLMEETNFDRAQPATARPRARFALVTYTPPFAMHTRLLLQLRFLAWPVPLFAGWAYGSTLIWFNVLNATASSILGAPPYSFSPALVGTAYLAPLVGTALALLVTTRYSDRLVRRRARACGGVMEPESRLVLFGLCSLIIPGALLLWGVGAAHQIHWAGLVVAMALLAFNNTLGASLSLNYVVDCYRELAGTALTAVVCVRNTMSFAIGYGITPWIEGLGLQNAFISAAAVGFVISLAFVGMMITGKRVRAKSARKYWKLVAQSGEAH